MPGQPRPPPDVHRSTLRIELIASACLDGTRLGAPGDVILSLESGAPASPRMQRYGGGVRMHTMRSLTSHGLAYLLRRSS